jgi:DNA-binding transcriptional LysR family regulator
MTFYNHSKIVLAAAAEAIRAVTPTEDRLAGTLRLSSPCCFGETVVPELLALLYAAYPLLKIDLTLNDAIVDPVTEGVDISLRLGKLANGIFIAHRLARSKENLLPQLNTSATARPLPSGTAPPSSFYSRKGDF